jgi:hypothetical protein
LPLALRKSKLARLLSRPVDGVFVAEYERGDIGDVLFHVACNMGLEGIVSKHLDRAYGPASANTGSRSRTPRIRRTAGSGTNFFSHHPVHAGPRNTRQGAWEFHSCALLPTFDDKSAEVGSGLRLGIRFL